MGMETGRREDRLGREKETMIDQLGDDWWNRSSTTKQRSLAVSNYLKMDAIQFRMQ